MTLEEIGRKNFTEKVGHGYLPIYEKHWAHLKNEYITLLEIGIYNGNSLRTWCEWFPNATIVGIDHNPKNPMKTDRAKLHFGKQEDWNFLHEVCKEYKGFDIIIDDGSHIWEDQQSSFKFLWQELKRDGMYIIEDLHTSEDSFWSKGVWSLNTVDFLKQFVDAIVYGSTDMASMHIYPKMIMIYKK